MEAVVLRHPAYRPPVLGGLLGPLVAWVEPGLILMGFAIRNGDAKGKLGRVPARVRRAARNDRRAGS